MSIMGGQYMVPSRRAVLFLSVVAGCAVLRAENSSPSDLVRFLSYQSGRSKVSLMLNPCSQSTLRENRAAARSLVDLGEAAVPAIEEALDSVEDLGQKSPYAEGAGWLLYAYAHTKGPAVLSRLLRMAADPKLAFLRIEDSAALAIGITSYVVDSSEPPSPERKRAYCQPMEPRQGLNHLILAWQRNDRLSLEASLGPRARAALDSLLREKTWPAMRAGMWQDITRGVAIGYHFNIAGHWSEPFETLEQDVPRTEIEGPVFDLDTLFKTRSGNDCGRMAVTFVEAATDRSRILFQLGKVMYLVDNPNLEDLLRLIGSCAKSN